VSFGELIDEEPPLSRRERRRSRRSKRRRFISFLAVLVSLAVVGALVAGVYYGGRALLGDLFAPAADYEGPGHGSVEVTIPPGATLRSIGSILVEADVVASQDAFVNAAQAHPQGMSIQAGDYTLMQQMPAEDAVEALLGATTVLGRITIPEGFRQEQIIERIDAETEFTADEITAALESAPDLGLPEFAEGNPEGFLFPATYDIRADTSAESLVQAMFNRFSRAADDVDLIAAAEQRELSPLEAVTVASIIQREVRRHEDMPDVAQVIYNRLAGACSAHGVPAGLLQMDSTVHFAAGANDSVFTSEEMRSIDSPYNTYRNPGLPPGPISAPGDDALSAALNPTEGDYCYFVTVNLESGETKFAQTEADHAANREELREWCRENEC
jgi:UPF0755 protein